MNISQTSSFLNIVLSLGRQLVGKWSVVGTFNKTHFESLNTKKKQKTKKQKTDNRTFWQTIIFVFTKRASKAEKIITDFPQSSV